MTQELSRHERAVVAEFGIHPEDTTPAAEARRHGWSAGTRLHGGPIRALAAEAERDALAAVIERVKAMADTDDARAWDAHQALIRLILNPHDEALTAILDTAPSDVLREHDAEVWAAAIQEARRVVQRRHGQPYETDIDLITLPNPYREKREDE